MYRLEGRKWKKVAEKKWIDRSGHSCQLTRSQRLVVLGGSNFEQSVDVLDLKSLTWSKVNFSYALIIPQYSVSYY